MKKEVLLSEIKLIVYDFDGVMTDNRVLLSENGTESVTVNRGDGLAVDLIKKEGIYQVVISSEKNKVVSKRGEKLGLEILQGISDKLEVLKNYCRENNISPEEVVFIGNDVNDLEAMLWVGCKVCPADAEIEIKEIADLILNKKGGEGVVREFARYLLARNKL